MRVKCFSIFIIIAMLFQIIYIQDARALAPRSRAGEAGSAFFMGAAAKAPAFDMRRYRSSIEGLDEIQGLLAQINQERLRLKRLIGNTPELHRVLGRQFDGLNYMRNALGHTERIVIGIAQRKNPAFLFGHKNALMAVPIQNYSAQKYYLVWSKIILKALSQYEEYFKKYTSAVIVKGAPVAKGSPAKKLDKFNPQSVENALTLMVKYLKHNTLESRTTELERIFWMAFAQFILFDRKSLAGREGFLSLLDDVQASVLLSHERFSPEFLNIIKPLNLFLRWIDTVEARGRVNLQGIVTETLTPRDRKYIANQIQKADDDTGSIYSASIGSVGEVGYEPIDFFIYGARKDAISIPISHGDVLNTVKSRIAMVLGIAIENFELYHGTMLLAVVDDDIKMLPFVVLKKDAAKYLRERSKGKAADDDGWKSDGEDEPLVVKDAELIGQVMSFNGLKIEELELHKKTNVYYIKKLKRLGVSLPVENDIRKMQAIDALLLRWMTLHKVEVLRLNRGNIAAADISAINITTPIKDGRLKSFSAEQIIKAGIALVKQA